MSEISREDDSRIDIAADALAVAIKKIIASVFPEAEILKFGKFSTGRVNDLYEICIVNPEKRLILRLRTLKDYHYEQGVLKEGMVKELLRERIRMPEIYVEENSREILPCEFTLMELIEGDVLSQREMTGEEAEKTGLTLAAIHKINFESFRTFDRQRGGTNNWQDFFKKKVDSCLQQLYKYDPELAQIADSFFGNNISRVPVAAKPVLNHHDYHGGNLIKIPDGNIAVIDWDYASIGVPEIDFSKIKHLNFRNNPALYGSFLRGYQNINGDFEKGFFERLKIYEALWLLRAYMFESTHENTDPEYFPESSYYKDEFLKIANDNSTASVVVKKTRTQLLTALEDASEHIFSTGLNDTGSALFRSSMTIGIAKLHYLQEKLGIRSRAIFISTPDENPLRRRVDWLGGFAYGGKLIWGDGDLDIVILNTKPNGCGMLVGNVNDVDFAELEKGIKDLLNSTPALTTLKGDKIDVQWDFNVGNHFIDIFDVYTHETGEKQAYKIVIIHSDAPELKGANQGGMGLYYNKENPDLHRIMKRLRTPFGEVCYLTGQDTGQYVQLADVARDFAQRKREHAFNYLFRDGEVVTNRSHQTLINGNQIVLGAYHVPEGDKTLFPITTNQDEESYLVRGQTSFDDKTIDELGFGSRAKRLGAEKHLRTANIIPHGSGYLFPTIDRVTGFDIQADDQIVPIAAFRGGEQKSLNSIREIPYRYRGKEVVDKSLSIRSLQITHRLKLLWTLTQEGISVK